MDFTESGFQTLQKMHSLDHVGEQNRQKRVGKVAGEAEDHLDQNAAAFEIFGQNRVGG